MGISSLIQKLIVIGFFLGQIGMLTEVVESLSNPKHHPQMMSLGSFNRALLGTPKNHK